MRAKFTPGPWLLAENNSPFVYALNEQGINRFSLSVSRGFMDDRLTAPEELIATAKLIAAAPDLLEALQTLAAEEYRDDDDPILSAARVQARAAIRKALGEEE